jgi:hypothetical protein
MKSFKARIGKIGVNPYVLLPAAILKYVFKTAEKDKGPVPVKGTIEGHAFIQTLVKYSGQWRLYINGPMLKVSNKKVGDMVNIRLDYDPAERTVPMHPALKEAFDKNPNAKKVFDSLPPFRRKEIVRYISNLKSEEAIQKNISRAVNFLLGKERFIGRDKPL